MKVRGRGRSVTLLKKFDSGRLGDDAVQLQLDPNS